MVKASDRALSNAIISAVVLCDVRKVVADHSLNLPYQPSWRLSVHHGPMDTGVEAVVPAQAIGYRSG